MCICDWSKNYFDRAKMKLTGDFTEDISAVILSSGIITALVFVNFFLSCRGRIKHTEVCQLLRQMVPPVGIGMKCPKIVAYKVLIFEYLCSLTSISLPNIN